MADTLRYKSGETPKVGDVVTTARERGRARTVTKVWPASGISLARDERGARDPQRYVLVKRGSDD